MRNSAEAPQQEHPLDVRGGNAGQVGSIANADHLSAARFTRPARTGKVTEVDGVCGVGDLDYRSAIVLYATCERIQGRTAMVTNIG